MKPLNSALLCLALGLTVVACGGASTQLHRHIAAGEYSAAYAISRGNDQRELELALLILEESATEVDDPGKPLALLGHAGERGRPMLERLEESAQSEVESLARVYRLRGDLPDEDQRTPYLESGYSSVRRAFVGLFAEQLDSPTLVAALLDIDPAVRVLAIQALGKRESSLASAQAVRETALKDPDISVRHSAAENPAALGTPHAAYDVLTELLVDEDLGIQLAAIRGLGRLGNPSAIERLEEIAARPLNESAVAAGAELIRLDIDSGAAVIDAALTDDRPELRMAALLQLERAEGSDIKDALERAIADQTPRVALLAAELARPHGGNLAEEALRRAEEFYTNPKTPQPLRHRARILLAQGGDAAALGELEELLSGEEDDAIAALIPQVHRIRALRPRFAELLAHSDRIVRLQAAYAVIANTST